MIEELQKRPFARPLLFWITGTLLQVFLPYSRFLLLLLLLPVILIGLSYFVSFEKGRVNLYESRWVWGVVFMSLLISLAVLKTEHSRSEVYEENPFPKLLQLAEEKQKQLLTPFENLRLTEQEKSVLSTITVGYRKDMNKGMRQRFAVGGVAHILSVSGFHVAVVCSFLSLAFLIFPRNTLFKWLRYLLMVALLWMFVYITGLAASSVRAAIMLSLYLTGKLLRKTSDSYNILAASAFCMLVYEPLYLFDIGFQLSYLAVLSILYFQPQLNNLIEIRNPLFAKPYGWMTVTVAAQVGTAFLCLYYFGQFSLVFLFTNIPLTIIATFLIPMAFIWMMIPCDWFGYQFLQSSVEILTRSMLWIVDKFSSIPYAVATFHFGFVSMLLAYGILCFIIMYIKSRRPAFLIVALSLLLIFTTIAWLEKLNLIEI
jgi:competence protein ComEC